MFNLGSGGRPCSGPRSPFISSPACADAVGAMGIFGACWAWEASTPSAVQLPFTPSFCDQGCAIADLDGDGRPDLAIARAEGWGPSGFQYRIDLDLTTRAGLSSFSVFAQRGGLLLIPRDVDGDWDLDLIITSAWTFPPSGFGSTTAMVGSFEVIQLPTPNLHGLKVLGFFRIPPMRPFRRRSQSFPGTGLDPPGVFLLQRTHHQTPDFSVGRRQPPERSPTPVADERSAFSPRSTTRVAGKHESWTSEALARWAFLRLGDQLHPAGDSRDTSEFAFGHGPPTSFSRRRAPTCSPSSN